jgi:hypothetical protein
MEIGRNMLLKIEIRDYADKFKISKVKVKYRYEGVMPQ